MGVLRRSCLGALLVPLVVVLVALALLGLGADRGANWLVGRAVESELQDQGATGVDASLRGFPFLTQLVRRDFLEVEIRAATLNRDGLTGRDLHLTLRGVRPQGSDSADVDSVTGSITVPLREIERVSGQPAGSLSVQQSQLQLRRRVELLGRSVTVVARTTVRVSGREIVVTPTTVRISGVSSPSLVRQARSALTVRYPIRGLPEGLRVDSVAPVGDGVLVAFEGSSVRLTR